MSPKLNVDMPDFVDSGGSRSLTNESTWEKGMSVGLGTTFATLFVVLGLGLAMLIISRLQGVPGVGRLIGASGTQEGPGIQVV